MSMLLRASDVEGVVGEADAVRLAPGDLDQVPLRVFARRMKLDAAKTIAARGRCGRRRTRRASRRGRRRGRCGDRGPGPRGRTSRRRTAPASRSAPPAPRSLAVRAARCAARSRRPGRRRAAARPWQPPAPGGCARRGRGPGANATLGLAVERGRVQDAARLALAVRGRRRPAAGRRSPRPAGRRCGGGGRAGRRSCRRATRRRSGRRRPTARRRGRVGWLPWVPPRGRRIPRGARRWRPRASAGMLRPRPAPPRRGGSR